LAERFEALPEGRRIGETPLALIIEDHRTRREEAARRLNPTAFSEWACGASTRRATGNRLKGGINDVEKNFASFGLRRALPGAFVVDVQ